MLTKSCLISLIIFFIYIILILPSKVKSGTDTICVKVLSKRPIVVQRIAKTNCSTCVFVMEAVKLVMIVRALNNMF